MNRIDKLFDIEKNGVLSVYFTAGFPNLNDTVPVIESLEKNGVKLIEIGIPFSDPMADGPVIQTSGSKALENGMNLRILFNQLSTVRESVQIPLVLMGYLNPIMQFGFDNFCAEAKRCGIDGVIIPDLPFEDYLVNYKSIAEAHNLQIIMLITPETSDERIRLIDSHTGGFIYMVSTASVTGAKTSFGDDNLAYFRRVNAMKLKNPRMIGFGISNKSTFDAACNNASGAIIGSKFVTLLQSEETIDGAVEELIEAIKN